ncbi:MAG: hypothetical protein IKU60_04890, partial [Clostridia bacterium]|nr:hypothetical protein [Clostridia bacterium]
MKKIISLILAVAVLLSFCVVPVMADSATATVTAALKGETVPQAGEKFLVSVTVSEISTGVFRNGGIEFSWPVAVASLAKTNGSAITGTNINQAITNVPDPYDDDEGTGTFLKKAGLLEGEGRAYADIYISSDSETPATGIAATEQTIFDVAFVLNEGQSYEDFYFTVDAAKFYFADTNSTLANGDLTVVDMSPKADVVWNNITGQPGYAADADDNTADTDGIFMLPSAITGMADVEFDLEIVAEQGDSLIAISKADTVAGNVYFSSSTVMMKPDGAGRNGFKVRNGSSNVETGFTPALNTVYNVVVSVDMINDVWGITISADGAEVYTNSNLAFRTNQEVLDAMVLTSNGGGSVAAFNVKNVKVVDKTPSTMGTLTFKYVCGEVELGTVSKTAEIGTEVSAPATTYTVGDVEYEAPAATATLTEDGQVVTVECAKVEVVAVNFTVEGEAVKTVEVKGVAGAVVDYAAVKFAKAGKVYAAEAGTVTVDPENLVVEVAVAEVANTVAASKTETFNTTTNAVYPYPTASDRNQALVGTDAMFSAGWGDTRYGEMVFDLAVEEGYEVATATLTITPADVMGGGYTKAFDIYAVDPATYGTANDLTALTAVGTGAFSAKDVAVDVALDLSGYDATNGIMLLYKLTDGLVGVYGASFEQAPYITYEIGVAEVPSEEPSSEEPSSEEPSSEEPSSEEPSSEEPSSEEPSSEEPSSEEPSSEEPSSEEPSSEEPSSEEPSSEEPSSE